jgi:hypothetical protein
VDHYSKGWFRFFLPTLYRIFVYIKQKKRYFCFFYLLLYLSKNRYKKSQAKICLAVASFVLFTTDAEGMHIPGFPKKYYFLGWISGFGTKC